MEYIYSALILNSVGKPITEEGITEILKAAGVTPDPARVKSLVSSLEGVNIEEAIKSSMVAAQPAAPAEPQKKEEKKEDKKEEKKEEKSEEEAVAGLGALFG
jgi:large subunit ribosomal protein L12